MVPPMEKSTTAFPLVDYPLVIHVWLVEIHIRWDGAD